MQLATNHATAPHPAAVNLGLSLLRLQLTSLLSSGAFTKEERQAATARIYATTDAAQLLTWKRNVSRVKTEREITTAPAVDTTIPDAEQVEAEATATELGDAQPAPTMWVAKSQPAPRPALRPRRTADYAGELAYALRGEAFTVETGLTYSDLATL